MRFLVLFIFFMGGQLLAQESGVDLNINITNIKEQKGVIRVGVFRTEEDYKQKVNQVRKGTYPVAGKTLTVTYHQLPAGFYAIILFHDLNDNDRNDSNAIGIPQEPFGLSNNIKPGVGLPPFSKTQFEVKSENKVVDIELQIYKKKWSVGAAMLTTVSPYVDNSPRIYPLPIIAFQGDKLDVLGTQAHYTFWRTEKMHFSLGIRLNFDGYNSDDSEFFEGMSDRKLTLEGGLKWHYHWDKKWKFRTDAYYDLFNVSNGLHGSLSIGRSFGPSKWSVTPSFGLKWEDENYVDYYYGVKESEENTDRPEYHPGFSIHPFIDCTWLHFWGDNWASYITASVTYLDQEIYNSPLVDKKLNYSFLMAFVYRF